MDLLNIKTELINKGYVIIPNILTEDEIKTIKSLHDTWRASIPNHDKIHNTIDPHGIYKHHEAGHQRHAWLIRTNPKVQHVFKYLWNCDKLTTGFDGSCYINKETTKPDKLWTHTDQAPNKEGLVCYQSFVSLTSNKERTLVVYEGTHKLHNEYFKSKGINHSKNWQLIDEANLDIIQPLKRTLDVPAGSLVLWDSRCFHQNQYGKPNSEERIVQYICMLPDNNKLNSNSMKAKRLKYFEERRTTSHWPYPINVNSKQPQTYGNTELLIDYTKLIIPEIDDLKDDIAKLL
jgi:hypothetical protein